MLKPVQTEKAMNMGKIGKYTFFVDGSWVKGRIKSEIARAFKVDVISVKTINSNGVKKAIVTLKKDQKIEAFEEKKQKGKSK